MGRRRGMPCGSDGAALALAPAPSSWQLWPTLYRALHQQKTASSAKHKSIGKSHKQSGSNESKTHNERCLANCACNARPQRRSPSMAIHSCIQAGLKHFT